MRLSALAFMVALAACSPESPRPVTPADSAAVEPADTADAPALALDAEGLRLVDRATGSTRLLAFGETDEAALVEVLAPVLGAPRDTGVNEECGAGPMGVIQWDGGLSALTADGRFVGWSVDGRADGARSLATMSGVGPGTTRAEAEQSIVLDVSETTLGPEFSAGGLTGLLSGDGPDAEITTLWAGTSCVFR